MRKYKAGGAKKKKAMSGTKMKKAKSGMKMAKAGTKAKKITSVRGLITIKIIPCRPFISLKYK